MQQEDQRRKGRYREKQGVLETEEGPELDSGFFADPSISEDERTKRYQNRVGHHLDVLINQERQRAEQAPADEEFIPLTEEQLNAEAERRTQADITKDIGLWQKTQDAAVEERQDAGATYSELDQLSDRSIEDIAELFNTGDISPEIFSDILLADRLSTLGGDSRNELRVFAVRNAETNNRYNAGAIAAAIIGGDP